MNGRCDFNDIIEVLTESCETGYCTRCPYSKHCFFLFFTDDEYTVLYTEGENNANKHKTY